MKEMKKNNKGFSMIEIIIVIAIMAILIAALGPVYSRYLDKAKFTSDRDLAGKLKTAIETAVIDPDLEAPEGNFKIKSASAPTTNTEFWTVVAEIMKCDTYTTMFTSDELTKKLKQKEAKVFSITITGNKVSVSVTTDDETPAVLLTEE